MVLSDDQLFYVINLQPLKLFVKKINYLLKSEQRVSSSTSNRCLLCGLIEERVKIEYVDLGVYGL